MTEFLEEKLYLTPFPFSPLFSMLMFSLATQRNSPITKDSFKREYDYIIVGAGSAGSVVASRLSELPCVSVLLLEAGKPPPLVSDVPSVAGSFVQSDIDWGYRTVPQRYTGSALINRQVILGQGKTLGGGSTINALLANRGNRRNYDEWAAMGAKGWSFSDVFQYFIKLENNANEDIVENGFHGTFGPVSVSRPSYVPKVKRPIITAALDLGYNFVDSSGPTQYGFYDTQTTLRQAQRCSAAKAYLVPSENRTNLDILSQALVKKILIRNKVAVGVEFDFKGQVRRVQAKKEVIVSAGAINTPKLLMLSGIGPMTELDRLKIPLIADLPVGENLQDHCGGFVAYELNESVEPYHKRLFNRTNIQSYIDNRTGPLGSASGTTLLAFLSNNKSGEEQDKPDHLLYFLELFGLLAKMRVGIAPGPYADVFTPYEDKPLLVCLSQILHPKSRGTVRLRTSDPYEFPDIDPNYLQHPQDVMDVVEGLKTCIKVLDHPALSEVGAKLFNTSFPGCNHFKGDLDNLLKCTVRSAVMSLSHPAGTAKMGDPNDPTTVVDPELRVKTIKRLRVVDASIMPTIIWGNTNLPTIMIGEKASDIIKRSVSCDENE